MNELTQLKNHLLKKGDLPEKHIIKILSDKELEKGLETINDYRYILTHSQEPLNLDNNQSLDKNQYIMGKYQRNNKKSWYFITGKNLNRKNTYPIKRCLAISHFYNEADIIKENIQYMLSQGIDLYLLDNWSDDNSYGIAKKIQEDYPNRIFLQRFPENETNDWELEKQLLFTEKIALNNKHYDWIIHHDIDELIHSPFPELTLQESISFVDHLGYNCIDKTILDFYYRPDQTNFDKPFLNNTNFFLGLRPKGRRQIKIWKNYGPVNLHSTGGHYADFLHHKNHCYEINFWVKHYQYRNPEQMKEKISKRIPRIQKEKNKEGWHLHILNNINSNIKSIKKIYNQKKFIPFNESTLNDYFLPIFFKIGNP